MCLAPLSVMVISFTVNYRLASVHWFQLLFQWYIEFEILLFLIKCQIESHITPFLTTNCSLLASIRQEIALVIYLRAIFIMYI